VDVVVRSGKVAVNSLQKVRSGNEADTGVILTAGFSTRVTRGLPPEEAKEVDVVNYLLWTSGGIYFDNTAFRQVLRDLERRFNVDIVMETEELLDVPFTGTFQYAELDEILSVIAATFEIEYQRRGSHVRFSDTLS
jgi:transmembrane sensor